MGINTTISLKRHLILCSLLHVQVFVLVTMVKLQAQLRCAIKENGDQCAMIIGLIMMQKLLVSNLDFPNLTIVRVPLTTNKHMLNFSSFLTRCQSN